MACIQCTVRAATAVVHPRLPVRTTHVVEASKMLLRLEQLVEMAKAALQLLITVEMVKRQSDIFLCAFHEIHMTVDSRFFFKGRTSVI